MALRVSIPKILMLLSPAFLALGSASVALADPPGDDMLKPDEIKTTGISSNPANDSGMYLGGSFAFGQARSTEEGTPGVGYFLKFQPGYQANRGTWGRLEFGADVISGAATSRLSSEDAGKQTLTVPLGILAKIGLGYSLGEKVFGVAYAGVGPAMGVLSGKPDGGSSYKSDSMMGLAGEIGWSLVAPMGGSMDMVGGISYTHLEFDVSSVKAGGTKIDVDKNAIVNIPAVEVGVRVRL